MSSSRLLAAPILKLLSKECAVVTAGLADDEVIQIAEVIAASATIIVVVGDVGRLPSLYAAAHLCETRLHKGVAAAVLLLALGCL